MVTELLLKFVFEASHSLADYEEIHPHIWKLELGIKGKPIDGRIVDMVELRAKVQKIVDQLQNTLLNENSYVSDAVREFPTCETLSQFLYDELQVLLGREILIHHPSVYLSGVMVALCSMNGAEIGAARLSQT